MTVSTELKSASADATEQHGARLASGLTAPGLLSIRGALGAGKTTFVRGLLRGLGYDGPVKSPTFTLVEPYTFSAFTLFHFDLYRLKDPQELEFMGWRDYLQGNSVCVVEWPERGGALLPRPDLDVMIEANNGERRVRLSAHTPEGEVWLRGLK